MMACTRLGTDCCRDPVNVKPGVARCGAEGLEMGCDDVFAWQLMNEPVGGSVYKPGDCNALADESGEGRCKSTLIVVLLGLVLVGEGGVGAGG